MHVDKHRKSLHPATPTLGFQTRLIFQSAWCFWTVLDVGLLFAINGVNGNLHNSPRRHAGNTTPSRCGTKRIERERKNSTSHTEIDCSPSIKTAESCVTNSVLRYVLFAICRVQKIIIEFIVRGLQWRWAPAAGRWALVLLRQKTCVWEFILVIILVIDGIAGCRGSLIPGSAAVRMAARTQVRECNEPRRIHRNWESPIQWTIHCLCAFTSILHISQFIQPSHAYIFYIIQRMENRTNIACMHR